MQNVFINGRYVKSKTVGAALERAYTSYIAPERFPVACLYLTIDPRHVDVNVHPAKLEVRFSDERVVFEAVYYAVRQALEEDTQRPSMALATKGGKTGQESSRLEEKGKALLGVFTPLGASRVEQISITPSATIPTPQQPVVKRGEVVTPRKESGIHVLQELTPTATKQILDSAAATLGADTSLKGEGGVYIGTTSTREPVPFPEVEKAEEVKVEEPKTSTAPNWRYVGEAFRFYLFVELEDETLLVIDQHAAHERVIFETLLERQKKDGRQSSQAMLLPLSVSLTPMELDAVCQARKELEAVGFTFFAEEHGVSITAIPDAITPDKAGELFQEMASGLSDGTGTPLNTEEARRERALYQIACKAAIKGGRAYGQAQIEWLIEKVLSLPDITVCPHGRPIAYHLTKKELDKQFDRIK
jgi:DNA mismatch repair protein MutL